MMFIEKFTLFIILFLLFSNFLVSCSRTEKVAQNINNQTIHPSLATPTAQAGDVTEHILDNEKSEKELHQYQYRKNLKIISVFKKITELDLIYLEKELSNKDQEIRKNKTFKLIDSLDKDTESLIKIAKLCRMFKKSGFDNDFKAAPIYDIAFFYSVKTASVQNAGNSEIMGILRDLSNFLGDSEAGDFSLALQGKDPKDLYGRP